MDNRDSKNLEENINNIVQDAINSVDFSGLSRNIGNTIDSALNEVRNSVFSNQPQRPIFPRNPTLRHSLPPSTYSGRVYSNPASNGFRGQMRNHPRYNPAIPPRSSFSPPVKASPYLIPLGRVSGTMLTVFGVMGTVLSGIGAASAAWFGRLVSSGSIISIAYGFLTLFGISALLWWNGSLIRKRVKRFRKYVEQLKGRNYCLIQDFSKATGFRPKYIVRDLKKMIQIGMFPEGHIDDKKTCFMLNRESYQQYLQLQENMRNKQPAPIANAEPVKETKSSAESDTMDPEVRKAIDEGRQYVQKIRIANIALPGEEVSMKLDRLEAITGKIFDYVEQHPEQYPDIKKFMGYYLPTTMKLLDAYKEFDYQLVQGENITTAKREIEKTLDTINHAFENLLDSLFEDAAMDISTDISVLETMFAQEGLTNKGFKDSENKIVKGESAHE